MTAPAGSRRQRPRRACRAGGRAVLASADAGAAALAAGLQNAAEWLHAAATAVTAMREVAAVAAARTSSPARDDRGRGTDDRATAARKESLWVP